MKRFGPILLVCALFSAPFVRGKGGADAPEWPDSLRSTVLYTEGVKLHAISGDTLRSRKMLREAIRNDSTFAPAYYELASNLMNSAGGEAVRLARRAVELDSANRWYLRLYGQLLLIGQRYEEALGVYRRLREQDSQEPDNYRILAALYEQQQQPFSAIAVLDSSEVRFGRIPMLSAMKRRLLVQTRQFDKAVDEAKALAESVPYEAEHHVVLAELYGAMKRDSLARAEYDRALRIDSTDVATLMSLADYYSGRQDYRGLLSVSKRLFASDELTAADKAKRFRQFTSDMRFYREYYLPINELASILAIKYPHDKEIVKLYADHLIASGELEQALELYKLHTHDTPPDKTYFRAAIDIESYLQRPDSVETYVSRALALFPDDPTFHMARGHAHVYAKRYRDAIRAYRNSLRHAATDTLRGTIWGLIGDAWQQIALQEPKARRKALESCYRAYDKSLAYYKDNPLVLDNYAYFLSEEDRELEKALEMASRTVALTDNNPTYLDTYAWVLFKLGRTAEAKKTQQQAIALDRHNSPELALHYGDILAALGERFMAEIYWRKALENGYDDPEAIARRIEKLKSEPPR